jgi:D,D-heptose 1,7-bisphosphate phosphatase
MTARTATVTQCVVRLDDPEISLRMVGARSRLGWILREFTRYGVTDFLLLTDQVPADLPASLPHPVRINASRPPAGAGSGGALLHVRDQLHDRFLWCDGSLLFDWNLATLLAGAATDQAEVIGRIARFDGAMIGGIGSFRRGLVDHLRPGCSLDIDVLPDLIARRLVRVTTATGGFDNDPVVPRHGAAPTADPAIGSRAETPAGSASIQLRRRALFLDRDGVLNVDHGYVGSRDRFEWVDGALDAIRFATEAGWHVFIVTNQSGVARGLYTEDAVRSLLDWIADQARAAGGTIDDVRFCPFHPDAALDAYRQAHPWRKPLPGMLLDLIRAWELDPQRAVLVGDQETDMRAAAAAGVAGHLFRGGNLLEFLRPILDQDAPDPNRRP